MTTGMDLWMIFAFFAGPPAIYLIDHYWRRRSLWHAERTVRALELYQPEGDDQEVIASRVEALVRRLDMTGSDEVAA